MERHWNAEAYIIGPKCGSVEERFVHFYSSQSEIPCEDLFGVHSFLVHPLIIDLTRFLPISVFRGALKGLTSTLFATIDGTPPISPQ
jgi:hypothetical protein